MGATTNPKHDNSECFCEGLHRIRKLLMWDVPFALSKIHVHLLFIVLGFTKKREQVSVSKEFWTTPWNFCQLWGRCQDTSTFTSEINGSFPVPQILSSDHTPKGLQSLSEWLRVTILRVRSSSREKVEVQIVKGRATQGDTVPLSSIREARTQVCQGLVSKVLLSKVTILPQL